ncbi:glycosyltransferase family 2 protein [Roseomonas sp. 18066]|uniref:glycosyltransferase family 2 protein n=1 Tax=Roseomonas sp. 18066 TaxID=2681412 RepID=UPI00135BD2BB|nr:glycosyltransferase [Roseomonas sp. 18066]
MNAQARPPIVNEPRLTAAVLPRPQGEAARRRPAGLPGGKPALLVVLLLLALAQFGVWRAAGVAAPGFPLAAAGLGALAAFAALRGPGGLRAGAIIGLFLLAQVLSSLLMASAWHGHAALPALPWLIAQAAASLLLLHRARLLADALAPRGFTRRVPALAGRLLRPLPKVSLHLPVADAPLSALRATLESLAELDHPALEVLVVDASASPDHWEPVAEHVARLGPRFRFFHIGACPQAARGFALRETAGDALLVGLVEPGTLVDSDWLRRCLPLFLARQGLGFVQAGSTAPTAHGTLAERLAYAAAPLAWPLPRQAANEQMAVALQGSLALLRVDALRLAGGWDPAAPDQPAELGLRLLRQGWEALDLPESMGQATPRAEAAPGLLQRLARHADVLFRPRHRGLTPGQRRHLLAPANAALSEALWLAMALLGIGATLGMLAGRQLGQAPVMPFVLVALLLPLAAMLPALLLAPRGHRLLALGAALALMPSRGAEAWRVATGWQTRRAPVPSGSLALMLGVLALASLPVAPLWSAVLLGFALPDAAGWLLGRKLRPAPTDWS